MHIEPFKLAEGKLQVLSGGKEIIYDGLRSFLIDSCYWRTYEC